MYIVGVENGELGSVWYVLESALRWIDKVLEMKNTRYLKQSLLKLINMAESEPNTIKYNYVLQVRALFLGFGASDKISTESRKSLITNYLEIYISYL